MSYIDGLAAINLDMPKRIPRTEYSIEGHWPYLEKLTGLDLHHEPGLQERRDKAVKILYKKWNYGFRWNVCISNNIYDGYFTKLGHAEFQEGGTDYNTDVYCPFTDVDQVLEFNPLERYPIPKHSEIVDFFNANYKDVCNYYDDLVNTTGIYTTCISGLIEIFGWDMMLMGLGVDAEKFGEVTNNYAKFIQHWFDGLADCDAPIVKVHDDMVWTSGPFAHPEWYRKYVFPNMKKYFAPIKEAGKKIIFTSDGTYDMFYDDLVDCGVNGFVLEPTNDMQKLADKYGKTHSFIGAVDTRILLSGSKEAIYNEVKRNIDIGKDCPGFFLAVGNHIPSNTPVENVEYYEEVYEKLSLR